MFRMLTFFLTFSVIKNVRVNKTADQHSADHQKLTVSKILINRIFINILQQ